MRMTSLIIALLVIDLLAIVGIVVAVKLGGPLVLVLAVTGLGGALGLALLGAIGDNNHD